MPAEGYPQQAEWLQQQAPYPQQPAQYQQATPQGAPAQQQTGSFQQAAPYMQAGLYQQAGFPQQYQDILPNHPTAWMGFPTTPEPGFQQSGQKFSTIQQHMPQAGETQVPDCSKPWRKRALPHGTRPTSSGFPLSPMAECGPTELTNAFGHSGPTWSRELATLSGYGFATKHGRKYFLTELADLPPGQGLKLASTANHRKQGVAHGYQAKTTPRLPSRSVNATSATGASSTFLDSAFPSNSPKRPSPSRPPRVSPTISSSNAPS